MRRAWLLLVPLAVLVAAWLLLRDDGAPAPEHPTPPTPAPAETVAAERAAERTTRPRARATAEDAPAAAPVAAKAPAPEKPAESIAASDSAGTLTVVDAETKAPLAGVRVAFMEIDPVHPPKEEPEESPQVDPVAWIAERGRALVTDADGHVSLPKFAAMAVVAARHADRLGVMTLHHGKPDWTLTLRRAVALAAIVVGADGKPCGGVTVQLVADAEWGTYPLMTAVSEPADGAARFPDVSQLVSHDDGPISLTVALPLGNAPKVAVDVSKPPAAPVRLVLPPTGRVRCEVVDDAGAPAPDGQTVLLRRVVADTGPTRHRMIVNGVEGGHDDARSEVTGGAATFAYVGVGLELEVEVPSADGLRVSTKQRFAGPVHAGEESVVRVALGGVRPSIAGRLVDAVGLPVPGIEILGELLEPGTQGDPFGAGDTPSTTDDGGRFRFYFDREPGAAPGAKLRLGRLVTSGRRGGSLRSFALVDLPAVLGAGVTDVGDVVFKGSGLLVAGAVVDTAGKPLAGATVRVMESRGADSPSPARDVDAATTDAEGRFRIAGDPSTAQFLLGVDLDGYYVAGRAAFAPGATDARVVMEAAGGIAGSVKIPDGLDTWRVEVHVQGGPERNGDADYRFGEGLDVTVQADGKFEVRTLRPGTARVVVELRGGGDATKVVVEGVDVVAGQVTRDPRLVDVDPAKSLRELTITVLDADKRPIATARVHSRSQRRGAFWDDAETRADGTAKVRVVVGGASGVTIVVTARGYVSAELESVSVDATVVLTQAKPVEVRVRYAEESPLPEPPFALAASLRWIRPGLTGDGDDDWGDPRNVDVHDDKFGKDRVLVFETCDPGWYRVHLVLWKLDMSSGGGSGIASVPASAVVTVVADSEPVEIVVGVDPDELRERTARRR